MKICKKIQVMVISKTSKYQKIWRKVNKYFCFIKLFETFSNFLDRTSLLHSQYKAKILDLCFSDCVLDVYLSNVLYHKWYCRNTFDLSCLVSFACKMHTRGCFVNLLMLFCNFTFTFRRRESFPTRLL